MSKDSKAQHRATRQYPQKLSWKGTEKMEMVFKRIAEEQITKKVREIAENKGFRHIGCCWNPLFNFGVMPEQYGSGGYGRSQWSQV